MCKVSGFQILNFDITVVGERDGSARMCSCQMRIVTKNKNVIPGFQFQSGNIWQKSIYCTSDYEGKLMVKISTNC